MDAMHSPIPQADAIHGIWNPNAVANWSIIFTPVFGSYLNMLNWQSMGERTLAEQAKKWFYASIAVILSILLMGIFLPYSEAVDLSRRLMAIGYLATWYYSSALPQMMYVKKRYGDIYPHRPWGKALLYAMGIAVAYMACTCALGVAAGVGRSMAGAAA
jgi:hypothetical protein